MPKRTRPSRSKNLDGLHKGAYRLPDGNYVTEFVGPPNSKGRRLRIMAVRRAEPDPAQVARALIAWMLAQTDQRD